MVHLDDARAHRRSAVESSRQAARQKAGDLDRAGRHVTGQARGLAREGGATGGALVERIEDDALFGVVRGQLEERGSADESHRHGLVVIEGPRIRRAREQPLHAGLRQHEHLGCDGHAERSQHRAQVAAVGVHGERGQVGLERLVQRCHHVASGPRGVVDGRMLVEQAHPRAPSIALSPDAGRTDRGTETNGRQEPEYMVELRDNLRRHRLDGTAVAL